MSTVTLDNKTILVTGAAGFIGSNLVKRIYQEAPSATVIGIDNMNAYYDVALKEFRLNELAKYPTFTFVKGKRYLVVGRRNDFECDEWIEIKSDYTDVEIVTYDDLVDTVVSQFYQ